MATAAFIKGLKYELGNRAFALRVMERMSSRLHGDPRLPFWRAYADLERLNLPHYQAAASYWGLDPSADTWNQLRAWAVGNTPKPLLGRLLSYVYPKTLEYLEVLKELQRIGPKEASLFLDYMVRQEEVQLEMMRRALKGDYEASTRLFSDFAMDYRQAIPVPNPR